MTEWPDYELLDFGDGRKLERFGDVVIDRPCPAAREIKRSQRELWKTIDARYDGDRAADGKWTKKFAPLVVSTGLARMELAPLPSGQVGIFPEQFDNWQWIAQRVERANKPLRVLNLFAYTGGSTLAAANAGAEVTHVDASKSMVARARANAALSDLGEHPIRWIVEDAMKFCQREVNRGNSYDAVVLDPPSYGHGPKGEAWSIQRDLLPLLQLCGQLTRERREFVLCTCHTPAIGSAELSAYLSEGLIGHCGQPPKVGSLVLKPQPGRTLASGQFARWPK